MGESGDDGSLGLPEALGTIARQRQEIERLNLRLEDEHLAGELRDILVTTAVTAEIVSPTSHAAVLRTIIQTAADVISARAGALLVLDREKQELIFEAAVGGSGENIERSSLPLGHGIAGLVAVTGQPMAVADAQNDPRQASDIAERVGYMPRNILCVPLYSDDEVVGVLELLDKEGAASFGAEDINALARFAGLAGIALEQSRTRRNITSLLTDLLRFIRVPDGDYASRLEDRLDDFTERLTEDAASFADAIRLASLVRQIGARGEREAELCRTLLQTFAGYLDERPEAGAGVDFEVAAW